MAPAVHRTQPVKQQSAGNDDADTADEQGLMKTRRATLLARIPSAKKGGWSAEWISRSTGADTDNKGLDWEEGERSHGKSLGGRYGNSGGDWMSPSRKFCGKTGIGLKGGIAHLVELLGRAEDASAPGTRLRAALTLEQLAEMEDAVVLIAAIGPGTAGPVGRLLTGEVEGATVRERTAAAGILALIAKLRRLKRAIAATPRLEEGVVELLSGDGAGPESQYAACKLLAEVGDVERVSSWAAAQPVVVRRVLEVAMCSLRGRAGLAAAEFASLEVRAAAALYALAALCASTASAALLVGGEEPRLGELVQLTAGRGTGLAAAALLSRLTEAEAHHDALAAAEVAPALMERIRESDGNRDALLFALVGLRNLAAHPPSAASIMANHGSAMISELLLFIRNDDDELLMPMLRALLRLAANEDNQSVMLHDGIILQLLPLLQHASSTVAEEVAHVLGSLASTASCSRSIVGTGGIALLVNHLLDEETSPPTSLRVAITAALVRLSALPENRSPIARLSLATFVAQVSLSEDREVQAATCRCFAVLAASSELKDAFLSIGLVDRLLNLVEDCRREPHEGLMLAATEALYQIASDSDKPLGEQTELGAVAIGGHYVARAATRALMEELTGERRSNPADILAWMQEMGSPDRQEAALRVVSKMPAAAAPALLTAEPELVGVLVGFLSSWHMPLRAVAANALARVAQSGQPARAAVLAAGAAPLLVQMLQMQTAETRVPGTRLMQKLADEEEAREMLVEAGAIEALLDQIEHAPDSEGRVSAAKALTNLSLSDACRSVMTPRGLQPLVEMLRPEISETEGQHAALRALQNMAATRANAAIILKAATKHLTELIQYSPIHVKVAGAKLVRNIACHEGLDLALAPAVIPVIDELLMQEEIKVVQVACQLIDCLTQRPHLRHTWQSHDVSDRLIKILLLGDDAGRYYAAQALDKLGTELSAKLADRKEAALMVDPATLRSASSTEVRRPVTSALPWPSLAEDSTASSVASDTPSKVASPKTPQSSEQRAAQRGSPLSTRRPPQPVTVRPNSASTKGGAASPCASSPTTSSRSIFTGDVDPKPVRQRPSSPLLRGEAKRVSEPSRPVEPKFGVGWEHRGASLRPSSDGGVVGSSRQQQRQRQRSSMDGLAISAALDKLAEPGLQAPLASMTSPGRLSSSEQRTPRKVKALWTEVKSVAKVLGLRKAVSSAAKDAPSELTAAKERLKERRPSGTPFPSHSPERQTGRCATFAPRIPGEKSNERSAEGVMPAPSTIFEDSSAEAKMAAVGEDSTPPGTPDGREAGGGEQQRGIPPK